MTDNKVLTGYGDRVKEWTIEDMDISSAMRAAEIICLLQEGRWDFEDENSEDGWQAGYNARHAAQDFESAYYEFDYDVIYKMHGYRFEHLIDSAFEDLDFTHQCVADNLS